MYYEVVGTIAHAEYVQAARRMMLTRKYIVSLVLSWMLSIVLFVFISGFATLTSLAVYALIFLVLFFAGQWFFLPYKLKKDLKKHAKKTEAKKWIFTDTHCEIISESVSIRYAWHEFFNLIQYKDVVLFTMQENKTMSVVIPLHLFGTEAKTIIAEIDTKIHDAAKKKSGS
ncbi:MAG: hypothetical protein ACTTH8_07065 [Treponema sp.]